MKREVILTEGTLKLELADYNHLTATEEERSMLASITAIIDEFEVEQRERSERDERNEHRRNKRKNAK